MHIANKLLRIALLVKLAIKATDNSDMYSREFPNGNFLFFSSCKMSLFCLPCGKLAFAQRSGAMKAPVGLLSDRTVLRSKMEGPRPDKFTLTRLDFCGNLSQQLNITYFYIFVQALRG